MKPEIYYNEISSGYDELHGEEQRRKLRLIKENINSSKKILDIGAGTGISTEFFNNIVCVEPSKKMLEEGLKKRKFKAINDSAENLEVHFKENEFDTIICVSTAHHFEELEKVFQIMNKICKQNGQIVITLLKNSEKTPLLIEETKKFFKITKEITEETDIVLFLNNTK